MSFAAERDSTLDTLDAALDGTLVRPGEAEWDTARAPWNRAVEQQPAAVVFPRHVDDLRHVLSAAHAGGFGVTVQPRGHGANADLAGSILVRPDAFDEVSIDAGKRMARVGAGVRWGGVLPQLDGTGLIALAGTNPDVSVTGFLLSGGHSWFSRRHGLAATCIRAVELVDAQGEFRRVTEESDPELLWALRGGGGLFGIVTCLEIELYEAPALFGGKIMFPADAGEAVVSEIAAIMSRAPRELSIIFGLINFPDIEPVPEPMRGHSFATADVVYVGAAEDGAALIAPLPAKAPVIANLTRPFTIGQLGEVSAEPLEPAAAIEWTAAPDRSRRPRCARQRRRPLPGLPRRRRRSHRRPDRTELPHEGQGPVGRLPGDVAAAPRRGQAPGRPEQHHPQ